MIHANFLLKRHHLAKHHFWPFLFCCSFSMSLRKAQVFYLDPISRFIRKWNILPKLFHCSINIRRTHLDGIIQSFFHEEFLKYSFLCIRIIVIFTNLKKKMCDMILFQQKVGSFILKLFYTCRNKSLVINSMYNNYNLSS